MQWIERVERRLSQHPAAAGADALLRRATTPDQALLLAGFWRSGTTLLLEVLASWTRRRTLFEPFHPSVPGALEGLPRAHFRIRDRDVAEACPYVPATASSHALDPFFESVLRGWPSTPWTRRTRRLRGYAARHTLVKVVRGNLVAGYLERRFGCRSILLFRHPCAVVASVAKDPGGIRTVLESDAFLDLLLADRDLVDDFLGPHLDHVARWRGRPENRVALCHALMSYVPLRQRERGDFDPRIIHYERLVGDPAEQLGRLADVVGRPLAAGALDRMQRDSDTTRPGREHLTPLERCFSWRSQLDSQRIRDITAIHEGFGEPLASFFTEIEALAPAR